MKYRIVAREKIAGISSDEGLWRLNGCAETVIDADKGKSNDEIIADAKTCFDLKYPNNRFDEFAIEKLEESCGE